MSWICCECGKRFRTVAGAQRAINSGCPKCGGVDIDLDDSELKSKVNQAVRTQVAKQERDRKQAEKYASDILAGDFRLPGDVQPEIGQHKAEELKRLGYWGEETDPFRPEIGGES